MSDRTTQLLHEAADDVWPRMPAAAVVRRSAQRGRRTRVVVGGAMAGAVVTMLVVTALGGQLTATPRPDPAGPPAASAGPLPPVESDDPVELSGEPFLHAEDWAGVASSGWRPDLMSQGPQSDLSTCLPSPLTWEAPTARAARFVDSTLPSRVWHEFVLRYDSAADAHAIVVDAWALLRECLPVNGFDATYVASPRDQLEGTEPTAAAGELTQTDELLYAQRLENDTRTLPGVEPGTLYSVRVARLNNVVVVLENTKDSTDRSPWLMETALRRAVGG